jgi:hypothetical protein
MADLLLEIGGEIASDEVESIKKIGGKARGVTLVTDGAFVRRTFGEEGLQLLDEDLARYGCPASYSTAKAMEWIPFWCRVLSLVAIKARFEPVLSEDILRIVGNAAPKYSLIVKLFMKTFASAKMATERAPKYWPQHFDRGTLESEYLPGDVGVNLVIHDYEGHPAVCAHQEGYFGGLFRLLKPDRSLSIEVNETKCRCRGDEVHRFEVRWS